MDQWILTHPISDQSLPPAAIPELLEHVTGLPAHYVVEPDPDAYDFYLVRELNAMRPDVAVEITMLETTIEEANSEWIQDLVDGGWDPDEVEPLARRIGLVPLSPDPQSPTVLIPAWHIASDLAFRVIVTYQADAALVWRFLFDHDPSDDEF